MSRYRLRPRERAGAINLRIIHGIIGRESQHTRLSFKVNGLSKDAVAGGMSQLLQVKHVIENGLQVFHCDI